VFCPVCKFEYHGSIHECSRCRVPLVESLPATDPDAASAASVRMEILWTGTDPEFAGSLSEALDRAELEHSDDSVALGFLPALPGEVFKISVRTADREAAERVLQDVAGGKTAESSTTFPDAVRNAAIQNPYRALNWRVSQHPNRRDAPFESAGLFESESATGPTPDDIVEDFEPQQATHKVWSGDDKQMAETVRICLSEVGIGSVVNESSGNFGVCVEPAAEARAQEIVREIIEQTPPE
jgi:hypothetical protein